jgi:hypothetical protein
MIGVRILLDVSVTIVALQAAVDAGAEFLSIHCDAVPGGVLHRLIAMTRQAICLGPTLHGQATQQKCEANARYAKSKVRICGFFHSAVFFLHANEMLDPRMVRLFQISPPDGEIQVTGISSLRKAL